MAPDAHTMTPCPVHFARRIQVVQRCWTDNDSRKRSPERTHATPERVVETEGENARAEDALALAEEIRERVRRDHGIELEYEVELWRANEAQINADEQTPMNADQSGKEE